MSACSHGILPFAYAPYVTNLMLFVSLAGWPCWPSACVMCFMSSPVVVPAVFVPSMALRCAMLARIEPCVARPRIVAMQYFLTVFHAAMAVRLSVTAESMTLPPLWILMHSLCCPLLGHRQVMSAASACPLSSVNLAPPLLSVPIACVCGALGIFQATFFSSKSLIFSAESSLSPYRPLLAAFFAWSMSGATCSHSCAACTASATACASVAVVSQVPASSIFAAKSVAFFSSSVTPPAAPVTSITATLASAAAMSSLFISSAASNIFAKAPFAVGVGSSTMS
ncbi:hypothetical protein, conserved in T. vivax [Trypanosoma vivax Y486]|uniref:Uncharacterized protein n=1 Tax=Trypanosoma vivax (strain Y486) TaxID=1055687 RepID=F9WRB4_TRYVY|nr:hypothetical protein, conserved in T. vivax [Trypanosoma vivax Y486]|eukprot:CCD20098.1 hypothetical protein, conserved in T. vivax [Trypanosoma vivax Y486]